jgi:hypothetical protein
MSRASRRLRSLAATRRGFTFYLAESLGSIDLNRPAVRVQPVK